MKILLTIHYKFDRNAGAAGATWQLGQAYQKLGHEVYYYSTDNLPRQLPEISKRILFPGFVTAQIANLCRKHKIDTIDASTGDAWIWGKIRHHSKNKFPLLVTRSHGLEHIKDLGIRESARDGDLQLDWKYPLYRGSFHLLEVETSLRCADLFLSLNKTESEYAIQALNVNPQRVHLVKNGIPETFLNLPFEPIAAAEDAKIGIAIIGTYIPRKGIQYSAPALNAILARYPQVKVSFLGTVHPEAKVYADFDRVVRDRVQVVPRYTHDMLPTLLKDHQIKLLSSISEGFPMSLVEAMACGLAPITTATPGPTEIVCDGHNGIVVPARDSQAIEQALERLITDRSYLEQLRLNAYSTAQSYSWQNIAKDTLSLYESTRSITHEIS
ncbi:glycosyltransferase family 4 protein [Oscillatoriales cyanobacterium LEGE 11467]|uniref:Glycosyltransferase family 4 protein n=1 Tax=Zarconia navalis LEGE 11467 TaxID=1828826 RepID=A0A928VXP5_9CYAN|nr:glycosyltransferase family 4 protein [Zarconia navalis]MBE9039585.1 glycosyltransferase family 4 protein [Zarconia navalis LEGE 11467]